jgi:6-phosphogluconolactonase (cycloisomerase 2 family)
MAPPAPATTATVGRQALTTFNDYFHCQSDAGASCTNVFSPTKLVSAGGIATVPGDGTITGWRVVGSCIVGYGWCDHTLRVLRPDFFGLKMKFIASSPAIHTFGYCDRCAPLDGTLTTISPGIPVHVGDYIALDEAGANSADVRVMIASAAGATYNFFNGYISDGTSLTPSGGSDFEVLFDADVVLDAPASTALDPPSGPVGGGQTLTITGEHLAGATHVRIDGVEASDLTSVSNTRVTAVTPAHAVGTVDVTVTTPGGTSDAMHYTYTDGAARRSSAYVTNSGEIWQYDVDPLGMLIAKAPTRVAVGAYPLGITVHPNGRSAYSVEALHVVRQFAIGPDGALVPMAPASVPSGNGPWSIAVSPDGRSAYVANSGTADISQYDIAADGHLAPKAPAAVAAGGDPLAVAISPDGRSVYAADYSGGKVLQYDADASGALAA